MNRARRSRLFSAVLVVLLPLILTGCGGRSPIRSAEVLTDSLLAFKDSSEFRLLRLRDSRGTVHEAWLRLGPRPGLLAARPYRAVVILGGIGTGRRAAEITPCPPGYALVALDYPYEGPRAPSRSELLRHLPEIHRAAHATPRGVSAVILYLAERRDMDPAGALAVGASFGVPFVVRGLADLPRARADAAAAGESAGRGRDLGPRGVRGVCLLFGGADLPNLVRYRMRERPAWEREAAALGVWAFFRDLEPARYVGRIAPRPLLLIGGTRDEFVSRASAEALYEAAGDSREQIWIDSAHLQPDAELLLQDLVRRTLEWDELRALR